MKREEIQTNEKRKMKKEKRKTRMMLVISKQRTTFMYFSLFSILFSFLLVSCPDISEKGIAPANSDEGYGSFVLQLDGAARTIMPPDNVLSLGDFLMYRLDFAAVGGTAVNATVTRTAAQVSDPVILSAGTYDLTVYAYSTATNPPVVGDLRARGTATFTITSGGFVTQPITLRAVLDDGTGTYATVLWEIYGAGVFDGTVVASGATPTITLNANASNASSVPYYSLGYHTIRVTVTVTVTGDPNQYRANLRFLVTE